MLKELFGILIQKNCFSVLKQQKWNWKLNTFILKTNFTGVRCFMHEQYNLENKAAKKWAEKNGWNMFAVLFGPKMH